MTKMMNDFIEKTYSSSPLRTLRLALGPLWPALKPLQPVLRPLRPALKPHRPALMLLRPAGPAKIEKTNKQCKAGQENR